MVHPDACRKVHKYGPGGTEQIEFVSRAQEGPKPMEHGSSSAYLLDPLGSSTYSDQVAALTGESGTSYKVTDAETTTTTTFPKSGSTSTSARDYSGRTTYSDTTTIDLPRIDMYGLPVASPAISDYGLPVLTQLANASEVPNIANLLNPAETPTGVESKTMASPQYLM